MKRLLLFVAFVSLCVPTLLTAQGWQLEINFMGLKLKERKGMQVTARPFLDVDEKGKIGLILEAYESGSLIANQMIILDPSGKILARKKDALPLDQNTLSVIAGDAGKFYVFSLQKDYSGPEEKMHGIIREFDAKLNVTKEFKIKNLGGPPSLYLTEKGQFLVSAPLSAATKVGSSTFSTKPGEELALLRIEGDLSGMVGASFLSLEKSAAHTPALWAAQGNSIFYHVQNVALGDGEEHYAILITQLDASLKVMHRRILAGKGAQVWMEAVSAKVNGNKELEIGGVTDSPLNFNTEQEFFMSPKPDFTLPLTPEGEQTYTYGFIAKYADGLTYVAQEAFGEGATGFPRPRHPYPTKRAEEKVFTILPEFQSDDLSKYGKIQYRIAQGKMNTADSPVFILMKK
jgi:hypothetical protein